LGSVLMHLQQLSSICFVVSALVEKVCACRLWGHCILSVSRGVLCLEQESVPRSLLQRDGCRSAEFLNRAIVPFGKMLKINVKQKTRSKETCKTVDQM
jgi:hypothetical protein